jgi:hypothetical protein
MSNLVTVTGRFLNASRYPLRGTVIFSPCVPAPLGDLAPAVVTDIPVTAPLNSAGIFNVTLVASDDPEWHTDCEVPYEVDIRVEGIRHSYHAMIPAPGPWDIVDLIQLEQAPNVATVPTPGPQGPPGPPGTGGAGYATDLGAVAADEPVTVAHGLSTFDVDVEVFKKDHPGAGASAGHAVEADVEVISLDEVAVTFSGNVPTTAGLFRVSVRALGAAAAVA